MLPANIQQFCFGYFMGVYFKNYLARYSGVYTLITAAFEKCRQGDYGFEDCLGYCETCFLKKYINK